MDFRLTDDQRILRDSVRDYLAGEYPADRLRLIDGAGRTDESIWDGLVTMGLTALLVPVEQDGLGMGLVEAVLVAVELGRANMSEPLADTALVAAPLLAPADQQRVAAGSLRVALAHPLNPWILDLDRAGALYSGGALSDGPGAQPALASLDPLRHLFAPVTAPDDEVLLDRAALIAAAQLVGGAEAMLAQATDYAKAREQFGQPIGSFQAIKHHLASVAVRNEFARPLLLRAAIALDEGHERAPVHVSHAKIAATDAAIFAAETAIQVHGAMGYTYEVNLHYWMKRAWALAGAWGDRAFHHRRVEQGVIGGTMKIGPPTSFTKEKMP